MSRQVRERKMTGWMIPFLVLLVAAIYYRLKISGEGALVPFAELQRISELGFSVILLNYARMAVPFVLVGLFLPLAFASADRIYKAVIYGAVIGLLLFLAKLFAPDIKADINEAFWAMIGIVLGFSLLTILDSLFKKKDRVRFPKRTSISSAFVILLAYLFCMVVVFVDNGEEFVPLNIFAPDQALPQQISCTADLDHFEKKAMTYKSVRLQPSEEIYRLSQRLDMSGQVKTNKDSASLSYQGKQLFVSADGSWNYEDEIALNANVGKKPPDEATANQKASQYVVKLEPGPNEKRVVSIERSEEDGTASVHYETLVDGKRIRGSGEMVVKIGSDGLLVSMQKFSADFMEYKSVLLISANEAWNRVLKGGVAHTLFVPVKSAVVTACSLAYWQEEVRGYLQPIWLFSGEATTETGEQKSFEIFIPAMR